MVKHIANINNNIVSIDTNGILSTPGMKTAIIEHPTNGTGSNGEYIQSDGSGGWNWAPISQSGGTLTGTGGEDVTFNDVSVDGNIIFDSSNYINFTPGAAPNYSSTVTADINTALNSNLYNIDTNFSGGRFNFAGDIEFFNNNYLILTSFGNIYKSSDFTDGSWQELDSTTTGITVIESGSDFTDYYSLYYNRGFYHFDNKLYILNQRDNRTDRTGYYSSDGVTWQPITDNNGDTSGIRTGIFIKVSDTNAIIYSPSFIYQGDVDYLEYNGTQWIRKTASQDQSIGQYESIFSNVLYSQNFSSFFYIPLFIGSYHHIFKTTNFLDTYQTVTLPSTGLTTVSYALIFELNDKIFIIPYDINNNQSEIYYTSDGSNFYKSSGTNTPDLFNCQLTHMEYSTQLNLYFAVGVTNQANSSSNDSILMSSDGINWSPIYDYNTFNSFISTVYGIDYVENCTHLYIKDNTDSVEIKFVLMDQISQSYNFGQRLYDIKATSYTVNVIPPESSCFEMNNNLKVSNNITATQFIGDPIGNGTSTMNLGDNDVTALNIPGLQTSANSGDVLTYDGSKLTLASLPSNTGTIVEPFSLGSVGGLFTLVNNTGYYSMFHTYIDVEFTRISLYTSSSTNLASGVICAGIFNHDPLFYPASSISQGTTTITSISGKNEIIIDFSTARLYPHNKYWIGIACNITSGTLYLAKSSVASTDNYFSLSETGTFNGTTLSSTTNPVTSGVNLYYRLHNPSAPGGLVSNGTTVPTAIEVAHAVHKNDPSTQQITSQTVFTKMIFDTTGNYSHSNFTLDTTNSNITVLTSGLFSVSFSGTTKLYGNASTRTTSSISLFINNAEYYKSRVHTYNRTDPESDSSAAYTHIGYHPAGTVFDIRIKIDDGPGPVTVKGNGNQITIMKLGN